MSKTKTVKRAGAKQGVALRADARRNRARVLEAAAAVFASEGPTASTEDVARAAGVGVGTVFRHFPTKAALLEALIASRLEAAAERAEALVAADDPGAAFFELASRIVTEGPFKRLLIGALAAEGVDPRTMTSKKAAAGRLHEALGRVLERAQQARAVRDDVDVPTVLAVLAGAATTIEQLRSDRRAAAHALVVVLDSLRPPRRARR